MWCVPGGILHFDGIISLYLSDIRVYWLPFLLHTDLSFSITTDLLSHLLCRSFSIVLFLPSPQHKPLSFHLISQKKSLIVFLSITLQNIHLSRVLEGNEKIRRIQIESSAALSNALDGDGNDTAKDDPVVPAGKHSFEVPNFIASQPMYLNEIVSSQSKRTHRGSLEDVKNYINAIPNQTILASIIIRMLFNNTSLTWPFLGPSSLISFTIISYFRK